MSPRPRIGVTTALEHDEQRLARAYVLAVERAGGLPMPAPMPQHEETLAAFAALLDGLVVVGGPAVTDRLIGTLPDDIDETAPERLAADRFLLRWAQDHDLPVLAICYGMQLASAEAGGTIYADVQVQHPGSDRHSSKRGGTTHRLDVVPDTHLHRILHDSHHMVNTRHLQAIETPGRGFRVAATAPDGVIEAIETADGRVIGVQFHPERDDAPLPALFDDLIVRAAARAATP